MAEEALTLDGLNAAVSETNGSLDGAYMLVSAYLVFLMQAGFAMLCAGSVRSKNTMNILLKNVLDACAGSIAFYLLGFGFAYGVCDDPNEFIGCGNFALNEIAKDHNWQTFLFQWAFAAAAATIVSGSVAERTNLIAYFAYSVFLTGFVYPVVVHWVWDSNGWLSAFKADPMADVGMIDFAGSGVVHMTGGVAGLMGAWIVGPRTGRYDQETGKPNAMPGHSATLVVLGTFLLWFGWYGFNPGSMLAIAGADNLAVTARTAVTTTLAAGAAGCVNLFLTYAQTHTWDLLACCNGLLAGLVSITSGCPVVEPWAALIAGSIGAVIFNYSCKLLDALRIDDPLAAAPMHGFCGAWGVFFVGLFAKGDYVAQAYGNSLDAAKGAFYGGDGSLLGVNILGIIMITLWVGGMLGALFFGLNMMGLLRVDQSMELAGLDVSKHGGSAYNMAEEALKDGPVVSAEH